ncbi:hypothetical protein BH11PAT1_BH11PAT1_3190 [soil metagenome]
MITTALTNKIQKGFTLVELLVVIAILGILAAALLATIDPLEQIKKGQDSGRLSIAKEYSDSVNRYYAAKGVFPWPNTNCTAPTAGYALNDGTNVKGCITELVASGELKASFNSPALPTVATTPTYLLKSYLDATTLAVRTCFFPASKSQLKSGTLVVASSGLACTPASGATPASNAALGATGCSVCVQ